MSSLFDNRDFGTIKIVHGDEEAAFCIFSPKERYDYKDFLQCFFIRKLYICCMNKYYISIIKVLCIYIEALTMTVFQKYVYKRVQLK